MQTPNKKKTKKSCMHDAAYVKLLWARRSSRSSWGTPVHTVMSILKFETLFSANHKVTRCPHNSSRWDRACAHCSRAVVATVYPRFPTSISPLHPLFRHWTYLGLLSIRDSQFSSVTTRGVDNGLIRFIFAGWPAANRGNDRSFPVSCPVLLTSMRFS